MRSFGSALALGCVLVACGGKAVVDGTAPGEGGAGAGGASTTTTTTTTTTHGGGMGGGPLGITLSDIVVGIDCMPVVPADPVHVSFTGSYDNGSSVAVSATIVGARLSLGGPPSTLDWTFAVSPASLTVPASSFVQGYHSKVDGSGSGSGLPCNFCSSPAALIDIDYLVDGQYSLTASGSGLVGCAL